MLPQIVLLVLIALSCGCSIANNDTTIQKWGAVIAQIVLAAILWWGGFWDVLR